MLRLLIGVIATFIFLLIYSYFLFETSIPEWIGIVGCLSIQIAIYLILDSLKVAR